jgi:hypothetical protein
MGKDKMKDVKTEIRIERKRKYETLTGVCYQYCCSASYDSEMQIVTFVLLSKFSGEIATEKQPPNRYAKL